MIELNKEMSWEEVVSRWPGEVIVGKEIGHKIINDEEYPISLFICSVIERGRDMWEAIDRLDAGYYPKRDDTYLFTILS